MKNWKNLILTLGVVLGLAVNTHALSGHLDITKVQTGKVAVAVDGSLTEVKANGDWSISTGVRSIAQASSPRLTWTSIGRVARLDNADPTGFKVDAYGANGAVLGKMLSFNGNTVSIPGASAGPVYLKLQSVESNTKLAARSSATDSSQGTIYYVIISDSGKVDTLREIKVDNWNGVLPTSYIVQRNVDVTVPAQYDKLTVRIGYYNIYTNPSNYYSVELGRYTKSKYSGFIYSAYDSASYAGNNYLYSALAIIKDKNDSVVAFSQDLDTVTAKVGNFSFDSSRFVKGIVNVRKDTLIVPWYAFNVKNGTAITAYHSVLKTLDSVIKDTTHIIDSAHVGVNWTLFQLDSTHVTIKLDKIDTNYLRTRFVKTVNGDEIKYELDSVYVVIDSKDSVNSKVELTFPYNPPSPGFVIQGGAVDTVVLNKGVNVVKFKATSEWVTPRRVADVSSRIEYTINIFGGRTTLTSVNFIYKTTRNYYK